ncbi:hypothetical protein [Lentzea aerocolonigenes]|uniref:hypothetical protein n=1 Tax=Lentzea aerocolonigenes TaxID=68170 RepID=UPI0012E2CA96|nr:hypothetical protein [Lentzea aerocolonigenes]
MAFEPITILTSAIAGGAAGVLMSSWKVHTEEGAKRRFAARQTIRKEATRLLVYLAAGRGEVNLPDDFDPTTQQGSIDWTATVLEAAHDLGYVRRSLVRRRLRRIVGTFTLLRADAQAVMSDFDVRVDIARAKMLSGIAESSSHSKTVAKLIKKNTTEIPGGFLKAAIEFPFSGHRVHTEVNRLRKAR